MKNVSGSLVVVIMSIFPPISLYFPPFLLRITQIHSRVTTHSRHFPPPSLDPAATPWPQESTKPPRAAADAPLKKKGKAEKERPEGMSNTEWAFDLQHRKVENASRWQRE